MQHKAKPTAAQQRILLPSCATVALMLQLPAWMWLQDSKILGILIPRRQSFASPIPLFPQKFSPRMLRPESPSRNPNWQHHGSVTGMGAAAGVGGGVNYKTHPPRIWGTPGTQNCPTPPGRGGGWVEQPTIHPASQPPKQYTRHEHGMRFQKFQKFLKHMSSPFIVIIV